MEGTMTRLPHTWLYLLYYRAQYRWQANHGEGEGEGSWAEQRSGKKERKREGETRLNDTIKALLAYYASCLRNVINNQRKGKCTGTYKKPFRKYATILRANSRLKSEYNRTIMLLLYIRWCYDVIEQQFGISKSVSKKGRKEIEGIEDERKFSYRGRDIKRFSTRY